MDRPGIVAPKMPSRKNGGLGEMFARGDRVELAGGTLARDDVRGRADGRDARLGAALGQVGLVQLVPLGRSPVAVSGTAHRVEVWGVPVASTPPMT